MMNKHTHPHLSWRGTAQDALQRHMGPNSREMRPGHAKRLAVALAGIKALQEKAHKQFESIPSQKENAAMAHKDRMLALATVLGGTSGATNASKGRKP